MTRNIFTDRPTDELLAVQRVHIEDYRRLKAEVNDLGEKYRSGQSNSKPIRREIELSIRQKLGALRSVNMIGEILDIRDGTVRV